MLIQKSQLNNVIIPVLPLRDIVIYPSMIIPLFIGRQKSIKCLNLAINNNNKQIMLVAQKNTINDNPTTKELFKIGTISSILQMLTLPDGTVKILIEGLKRAKIKHIKDKGDYFIASIKYIINIQKPTKKQEIFIRALLNQFETYLILYKKIPIEILHTLNNIKNADTLTDTISAHMPLKLYEKQEILELFNVNNRIKYLITKIETEIDLLKIEKKIRIRIKQQMNKNQKEYYLNEQMKAIQKELGHIDDIYNDFYILKKKIISKKLSKEATDKVNKELNKLKIMPPMSAESSIIRNYIDWILQIPWYKQTPITNNLKQAQQILNKEHYGLKEIKERIIEYLAVITRKISHTMQGPILCFIGPPGVGKTSLGKSISKATGRKYIKISLGGLKDEAEIRGHRRTYIGSMPGKIMQQIIKSKVNNPLFLLDEIDKISIETRGDPASALLEVLDPENNNTFNDHYLEINYNLSNTMFIATANTYNIPAPLLDRMEIIPITGYTEYEKLHIAIKYIIKKQMKKHALQKKELQIKKSSIIQIIRLYTKESGVRNLEREIAKICRKTIKIITTNKNITNIKITNNNLINYLGTPKFISSKIKPNTKYIGQVTGLAWTENGGDLIQIESLCIPGNGKIIYTGSLGKIMKESIKAALTVVKYITNKLKINYKFYENHDIHVHIPEGAIPKDGPSAGITICTALMSTILKYPVKTNIAMTGEITLHGNILPIGGLKEKLLAAIRGDITHVILPSNNKIHLYNISNKIKKKLKIYLYNNIIDVFKKTISKKIFEKYI